METVIQGRVYCCGDNVIAYDILPLERKTTGGVDRDFLGQYALEGIDPSFAAKARAGEYSIVIGGINFGGGAKSIEHPVHALLGANVKIVVAQSMARYFFRNAINNGLPVITCDGITEKFKTGDEIKIDLTNAEITNVTTGEKLFGVPLDEQARRILECGGLIGYTKKQLGME
ncbi:MAG: 3-isopropylmalate dehydratase [Firmicutes bacterium]|nr:3-isopropylmalate dehydratase [Bacillota bacterium]